MDIRIRIRGLSRLSRGGLFPYPEPVSPYQLKELVLMPKIPSFFVIKVNL